VKRALLALRSTDLPAAGISPTLEMARASFDAILVPEHPFAGLCI